MNCDALAGSYWWWEHLAFGGQLQQCRTAFLPRTHGRQRALILGEGDGRFLLRLLQLNPEIRIDSVDSSERMIHLAKNRVCHHRGRSNVRFIRADACSFVFPEGSYDLIVTHFFLDCFAAQELPTLVSRVAASATEDALWLLADFHEPASGLARLRAKAWLGLLYAFFGLCTGLKTRHLSDPTACLSKEGFVRTESVSRQWRLLKSELWERPGIDRS